MPSRGPYQSTPSGKLPGSLGERIKAVRMAWHWTQVELGLALNTDQTTVSSWERERVQPSGPTLAALAGLFKTTPDALETGKRFNIPDSPPLPGGAPKARMVELRDPEDASTQFLDLKSNVTRELQDPQEAILKIIQASREGKKIWVVVE